jgi:hypothetical protein
VIPADRRPGPVPGVQVEEVRPPVDETAIRRLNPARS